MEIFKSLDDFDNQNFSYNLTIGMFDGMHLGHQNIINEIIINDDIFNAEEKKDITKSFVITFNNHPLNVILNKNVIKSIYPLSVKLKLLEKMGVDNVLIIDFTKEFANITYQDFLNQLFEKLQISKIVLGENACFGKDLLGNSENVKNYLLEFETKLERKIICKFLPIVRFQNISSSSEIRYLLQNNFFNKDIKNLILKDYLLYLETRNIISLDDKNTLTIEDHSICLPPVGKYDIEIVDDEDFSENSPSNDSSSEKEEKEKTLSIKENSAKLEILINQIKIHNFNKKDLNSIKDPICIKF
jgi:hypothetical protein